MDFGVLPRENKTLILINLGKESIFKYFNAFMIFLQIEDNTQTDTE